MGITVRRLTGDDWRVWREARLAALADAPYAFGSSLEREQAFTEADWRAWLTPEKGLCAVAFLDDTLAGAIGGLTLPGATSVLLVAMWVRPTSRGHGIGDTLIREVLDWSREHGWLSVDLRVADGNVAARSLFLRHGFQPTGRREPLESDPTVGTEFLTYPLHPSTA